MPAMKKAEFLTLNELSDRWHVSRRTLTRWLVSPPPGKPSLQTFSAGRRRLIYLQSVQAWESGKATPVSAKPRTG